MQITGKDRSRRIDRYYHTALDPNVQMKRVAGIWAAILCGCYALWTCSSVGIRQVSSGDLSRVHAAWSDTGCDMCHLPNVPIRADAFLGNSIHSVKLNNEKCNSKCHSVTGHFELRTSSSVLQRESCTNCHREHLGRDYSLVALADQNCVRCHRRVAKSRPDGFNSKIEDVANFSLANGHPEFHSLKLDPGTIKFSHAQHLRPGQPKISEDRTAKKLEDIPERFQAQYATRELENGLIQLQCSDCHQRDHEVAGFEFEPKNSISEFRQSIPSNLHSLYQPVRFDKHCLACHGLGDIPHGLNRTQMKTEVPKAIDAWQLAQLKRQPDAPKHLGTILDDTKLKESLVESSQRLELLLNNGEACIKCHQLVANEHTDIESADIVVPSRIPNRWLKNVAFKHGSHLMVKCDVCHELANAAGNQAINSETEADMVMIKGLKTCQKCHRSSPEERADSFSKGEQSVATAACVDCHRYHTDSPKTSIKSDGGHETADSQLDAVRRFVVQGGKW